MRGNGLLHLHRLQHQNQVALSNGVAVRSGNLHDGALHGAGQLVAATLRRAACRTGLAGLGGGLSGRLGAATQIRQGHLQTLAVDLNDHGGALILIRIHATGSTGVHGDGVVELGLNPTGVHLELAALSRCEGGVIQHDAVERDDGGHTLNAQLSQGTAGTLQSLLTVRAGDNELSQHGVKVTADNVTSNEAGIPANTGAGGHGHLLNRTGSGHEGTTRILAVNTELEGVTAQNRVLLLNLLAAGNTELLTNQIQTGNLLGDRVLHLQTGVHLKEGDGAVGADQELTGAGTLVASLAQNRAGRLVQAFVLLIAQVGGGCLLNELLVTTLQRAVTGGNHHNVAMRIRQALGLNMAGRIQEALDEALTATERRGSLTNSGLVHLNNALAVARHLNAAATATKCGLHRNGQTVLIREGNNLIGGLDRILGAGHQGSAHLLRDVACRHLIAQLGNGLGGGANPGQTRVDALLSELRVLRKETVAGVHSVSAGTNSNLNELVHHQVGLCRGGTAESVGFIGKLYVLGVAVGVSIDGDGLQTLIAGCANHADSNFTAVSDQNLADRAGVAAGNCSKFLGGFCLVLSHLKLSFNLLLQGYIGRIGEYNAHHTVLSYRLVFNNVYFRARFETDLCCEPVLILLLGR